MCPSQHSDSEDDTDYVPPIREQPDPDSTEDESQPRGQTGEDGPTVSKGEPESEQRREALWTSFQASLASPEEKTRKSTEIKMVKVQKRYLFAGEYTTEVVEVPEDSVDAKKWPLYQETGFKPNSQGIEPDSEAVGSSTIRSPAETQQKKPGPRKPKKVLGALPSSSSQKAKKLTTLDKSVMDWKSHTASADLQAELDTNRKNGGYLEKVEFLQRVEERKEENLEAMKSRKRRKL